MPFHDKSFVRESPNSNSMFSDISKKESGCIQERKAVTQIRQELGHVSCGNLCFLHCWRSADIGQVVPIPWQY